MNDTTVKKWFQELKRIWIGKDIQSLRHILAEQFIYYEDPFQSPITTWRELEEVWKEINDQDIQTLEITNIIDGSDSGFASYHFSFIDLSGVLHEYSGVYYLKLDVEGRATEFRQWWMEKESDATKKLDN